MGEDGKVTYCNNGPCYGECANGERFRTQGIPKKSKELDYVHVMQVMLHCCSVFSLRTTTACFHCLQVGTGANYAVFVVRDTEEEDVEEIDEYELLDQTKIEFTEADMKAE